MDSDTRPYWLQEAFVREHGRKGPSQLLREFPDTHSWSQRRAAMKGQYPDLVPSLTRQGQVIGASVAPAAVEGGAGRDEAERMTTEQRVEADRQAIADAEKSRRENAEYARALKAHSAYLTLVEHGREVLEPIAPLCPAPQATRASSLIHEGLVLNLADWHLDEIVDEGIMEGLNVYNPAVAVRRVACAVDKTLMLSGLSERIVFDTLYVHCFGDFLTNVLRAGFDHPDALATAAMMPMKGARFAATLLSYALRDLAAKFPAVKVRCVIGNHGRNTKSMPYQLPTENLDWLIYRWAATMCGDMSNVTWEIPEAWSLTCDVEGWGFFLNHGYTDAKGGFGGISWYSLVKSDTKRTALDTKIGRKVLVRQYGHMHQQADVGRAGGNGRIRIEPSLMGGNAYAKEGMAGTYDEPAQSLLEVHTQEGLVAERTINIRQYDDAATCRFDPLLELI